MASIVTRALKSGALRYDVRYRVRPGATQDTKTFVNESDAKAFAADVERSLSLGLPVPTPHRRSHGMTLGDWYLDGWRRHYGPRKEEATRRGYRDQFRFHIANERYGIADRRLDELVDDPTLIEDWLHAMQDASVGAPTRSKAYSVLSGLLTTAARRSKETGIKQNPLRFGAVEPPTQQRLKEPMPVVPLAFEAVRLALHDDGATLMALGSLGGLRPQEALALTKGDLGERSMSITKAVAQGRVKETKTRTWRYPPLFSVLREVLPPRVEQLADDDLLIARPDGSPWTEDDYKNWRKRSYAEARARAARRLDRPSLLRARPYDVGRHSYASCRILAGSSLVELAQDLGHSLRTLQEQYASVLAEYRGAASVDFEAEVRAARRVLLDSPDAATGTGS